MYLKDSFLWVKVPTLLLFVIEVRRLLMDVFYLLLWSRVTTRLDVDVVLRDFRQLKVFLFWDTWVTWMYICTSEHWQCWVAFLFKNDCTLIIVRCLPDPQSWNLFGEHLHIFSSLLLNDWFLFLYEPIYLMWSLSKFSIQYYTKILAIISIVQLFQKFFCDRIKAFGFYGTYVVFNFTKNSLRSHY